MIKDNAETKLLYTLVATYESKKNMKTKFKNAWKKEKLEQNEAKKSKVTTDHSSLFILDFMI